jgi:hypothetical protein
MKRKGNIFFGAVVGLIIFVFGVLIIPFFADDITTTRVALDCTNTSIYDGTKLTCLGTDLVIPYFIWFFVSVAVGYFVGK